MDDRQRAAAEERKRFSEMHGATGRQSSEGMCWQDRIVKREAVDSGERWQDRVAGRERGQRDPEGRNPYGHPGYGYRDAYNNAQYGYWDDRDRPRADNAAIGGMIFGIPSVVLCWNVFGLVFGVVAVILSLVARSAREKRGYWIAGLVTGIVGLALFLIVLIMLMTMLPPAMEWMFRLYGETGRSGGFPGGFPGR